MQNGNGCGFCSQSQLFADIRYYFSGLFGVSSAREAKNVITYSLINQHRVAYS